MVEGSRYLESRLSSGRLLAYSGVYMPLEMLGLPVIIYVPPLFASELGLDLAAIGAVFFFARLWDGFTDPIIGAYSDKWILRKPWVAIGGLVLLVAAYFLLRPPSGVANTTYLAVVLIGFYLAWTAIRIPYLSWGAELSKGYRQRNRIVGFREGAGIVGTLLATGLPLILLDERDAPVAAILEIYFNTLLIVLPVTVVLALVFVPDPKNQLGTVRISWFRIFRVLVQNKPFLRFLIAYTLIFSGISIYDASILFLIRSSMLLPTGDFLQLVLIQYVVMLGGAHLTIRIANRIGKHRAICASALAMSLAFVWISQVPPSNFWHAAFAFAFFGLAFSPTLILPTSLIADATDYAKLVSRHSQVGVHMSIFNLVQKLCLALGVGVALPLLDVFGYKAVGANDADGINALLWIGLGLPAALMIPAFMLMWTYPITRDRHTQIRNLLNARESR